MASSLCRLLSRSLSILVMKYLPPNYKYFHVKRPKGYRMYDEYIKETTITILKEWLKSKEIKTHGTDYW